MSCSHNATASDLALHQYLLCYNIKMNKMFWATQKKQLLFLNINILSAYLSSSLIPNHVCVLQ